MVQSCIHMFTQTGMAQCICSTELLVYCMLRRVTMPPALQYLYSLASCID